MVIRLEDIGKRFGMDWIFRDVQFEFESGKAYALTGPNGSGKSTLMKIISLSMTPSKGQVRYIVTGHRNPDADEMMRTVAFAAPYISLVQEFTLEEMLQFHFRFRKMLVPDTETLLELSGLSAHRHKQVQHFSSGMTQRLKLSLSILSDTPVLLLDEPTSNLDAKAAAWYHDMIQHYTKDKIVIIGSNQPDEYSFASGQLHVPDFKR